MARCVVRTRPRSGSVWSARCSDASGWSRSTHPPRHARATFWQSSRPGASIGIEDVQIAATALARGFAVVTANTRLLARISGLAVENWAEGPG